MATRGRSGAAYGPQPRQTGAGRDGHELGVEHGAVGAQVDFGMPAALELEGQPALAKRATADLQVGGQGRSKRRGEGDGLDVEGHRGVRATGPGLGDERAIATSMCRSQRRPIWSRDSYR